MIRKLFDITALKFALVGIINTIVGTGIMFLLYNIFGVGYWISSAANYVVGSIVSYLLNKYFTFKKHDKSIREVVAFVINITVCYFISYGCAKPLVYALLSSAGTSLRDNVAMLIGMCLFVVLNYLGQRFIVFKIGGEDDRKYK